MYSKYSSSWFYRCFCFISFSKGSARKTLSPHACRFSLEQQETVQEERKQRGLFLEVLRLRNTEP